MFRILIASLFAISLLASGCKSHESHHPHHHHDSVHRTGHGRVAHPSTTHHHHRHEHHDVPPPPNKAR